MKFTEFSARKEADALAARLAPFVTEVDRGDSTSLRAIGNDWSRGLFGGSFYVPEPRGDVPATNVVFVQSRDGNTGAANPSALGGGETDKHLIYEGLSRVAADAVLGGAATVRGGDIVLSVWHPQLVKLRASLGLPRHPIQIVATLRGVALESGLIFNVPEIRVFLLTIPSWVALMHEPLAVRPWITPVIMETRDDLQCAFRQIRALGVSRISCIGGRTIARQLINAGLVEDLYLTTSAKEGGEPNTPLFPGPLDGEVIVRKRGTREDEDVTFEHVRLRQV